MDSDKQVSDAANAANNTMADLLGEGTALLRQGNPGAAGKVFDTALALQPLNAEALHGAALALYATGKAAESVPLFEKALDTVPGHPVYANNYAMALMRENRLFEAKSALILATRIKPDYADAWVNLATALMRLRENGEVIERALMTALALAPAHPHALAVLAELRAAQGRFREAGAVHLHLAEIKPDEKAARTARAGMCHAKLKDFETAASLFGKAASLAPENGQIQALHGAALGECGRVSDAKAVLQRAATLKGGKGIFRWKHLWYCPEFFPDTAAIDEYWDGLQRDLAEAVADAPAFDWRSLPTEGFAASFNLTHLGKNYRHVLEQYANFFGKSFPFEKPAKRQRNGGRIRIGFFAAPLQGRGFLRINSGIIRNLDPTKFECLLLYPRDMTSVFAPLQGPHIIHASYLGTFEAIVNAIRAADLDILYHWKAGETPITLFLPMCNTAPVQCTSWGTHGTSGIRHIDYSVSWNEAEPENAQDHYTETLVRLVTPPLLEQEPELPPFPTRSDLGLPAQGTLFFCPHRIPKYHPDFDFYLRDILENDGSAHVLLLFESHLPSQELTRRRMLQNVGPKNARRLLFLPRTAPQRYMQIMAASDMVLESPVYSTSLSGFDALYLGKPLITQEGARLIERYAAANYRAMRIFDAPITQNRDGYVAAALRLSHDAQMRLDLGERIRTNAKIFLDTVSVVEAMSDFFERAAR